MHHVHRVLPLPHMQARQSAPCAADGIERAARQPLKRLHSRELLTDDLGGLFWRTLGEVHQRQAAQREGHPRRAIAVPNVSELERAAAQVTDDAVRLVNRAYYAKRRQFCFPLATQELDFAPKHAFRAIEEFRSVRRVAHSGRRDAAHVLYPHRVAENAKALKRGHRLDDALLRQKPGHRDAFAETA